jgi:hypothetical protein
VKRCRVVLVNHVAVVLSTVEGFKAVLKGFGPGNALCVLTYARSSSEFQPKLDFQQS